MSICLAAVKKASSNTDMSIRVLHIANWYPNPWNEIEGNYIRDHIRLFDSVAEGRTVVVQVRSSQRWLPSIKVVELEQGVRGYFLFTRAPAGKITEWLATLMLVLALLRARAWRFDLLHFHVAYPLLVHVRLWHWMFRKPVLISEHWSAYHFNFHLPSGSKALQLLRRPFGYGYPVLAVSQALLDDIRRFAECEDIPGHIIPNSVPLHGASSHYNSIPILFSVNRWVPIKDPMPMLEGLARATESGAEFQLVLGGFGDLTEQMRAFVKTSALADRTLFLGKMTKDEIAQQLARSDGYLFSSHYETFSVASAEALGAGVPLIGPHIPAIAEYAAQSEWEQVATRDADGWEAAVLRFLERSKQTPFDRHAIAAKAAHRFEAETLRRKYRSILEEALTKGTGSMSKTET